MRLPNVVTRYAYALAISVAGVSLQTLFWPAIKPHAFHFMHPSVFLASYLGGLGPGLFATVFCAFMSYTRFISTAPGYVTGQAISQVLVFMSLGITYALFNAYLRNTKAKLAQSLAVRDEFLSIASHELKTPITTLVLQLEIARMKIEQQAPELWPALTKYFSKSKDQADKLVALVDDLLNVTRVESGKVSYDNERFDLSDLTQEITERFEAQLEQNKITLTFQKPEPIWIFADRTKIGQVLTNLMTNAMKYGEGKPVVVTIAKEDKVARIAVKDNGMGIASDKHKKIFERFERAISARNISGLGLGLYISNSIVVNYGGKIYVESELGLGSTFFVELPSVD